MKNILVDLYFEINPKEKKILSPPEKLEINWKNISGIVYLNKDELYDLSWAGYPNHGFLKFSKENEKKLKEFECDSILFEIIKSQFKDQISSLRYEIECSGINIDNRYEISTDDRSKTLLLLKYLECNSNNDLKFKWKSKSGFIDFTSSEFIKMVNEIQKFFQKLFDLEFDLNNHIDKCNDILDIFSLISNDISWPSNMIKI